MIQNIIFDFDGVLVDSEIIAGRAFSRCLADRDIDLSEQEFARTYSGNKTINVVSDLSSRFNIKDNEVFLEEIMSIVNNIYNNELATTPGIKELLNTIQHTKLICSNSPKERIIKGLKKVSLSKYFDESKIFSFDMVKKPKPEPDIYLTAIKVTSIEPEYTIIVEDSVVGVQAGIAANMKVIGLTTGGHWAGRSSQALLDAGSFAVANSYQSLLKIIKEL